MKKFLAFMCLVNCVFAGYLQAVDEEGPKSEQKSPRTIQISAARVPSTVYTVLVKEHPLPDPRDRWKRPGSRLLCIATLQEENKINDDLVHANGNTHKEEGVADVNNVWARSATTWRVLNKIFPYRTKWSCKNKEWWTYYAVKGDDLRGNNTFYLTLNNSVAVGEFVEDKSCSLSIPPEEHTVKVVYQNCTIHLFDETATASTSPACCCSPGMLEWLWTCNPLSSCFFGCWWGSCCPMCE